MADVQVGDKVRLIRRTAGTGTVDALNGFEIKVDGNWFYASDYNVEVIEKAKPVLKVGDVIRGSQAFDALPTGTVVAAECDRLSVLSSERVVVKTTDGFFLPLDGRSVRAGFFGEPRKIVFLP